MDRELLLSVSRPGRYIGGEWGAQKKEWAQAKVRACLCFPDTYEIGMSHLGIRLLYDLVNRRPEYLAERVFAPWLDMEAVMRERGIPLWALESRRPVRDFDILGFSLSYELCYTNVLNVLDLSGIPVHAAQRDAAHPLVIAGGGCCLNPEPMAAFIDAFVIGEGEEVFLEVMDAVKAAKEEGVARRQLLERLAVLPGVYVLSLYGDAAPPVITKRIVRDLVSVWQGHRWIVPYLQIVHDRVGMEIMRGCPRRCRFCQARVCFYPLRVLPREFIIETVRRLCRETGYEEASLLSLSSSDYPDFEGLATELSRELGALGISMSLPSVRPRSVVGALSHLFASFKKTTLTFAPEAGTPRLREMLGKDFEEEELFATVGQAFEAGYRQIKLYFMIGLPTETEADLDALAALCLRLSDARKRAGQGPAQINVSVANFVPKPHTAFERAGMEEARLLREKQACLKRKLARWRGRIQLKFHDPQMSRMECLLARGDRRAASAVEGAWRRGARFDAWTAHFRCDIWEAAWQESGLAPEDILRAKAPEESLPWSFVDTGSPAGSRAPAAGT
ncbi:MAG: TIGR03960 family B12-binding radical SAM protein [Deltaproteobacteria bacterium]